MTSLSLFDLIPDRPQARVCDWTPEPPPSLDGIHDIQLNFETTGLRWWDKDRPIAASLGTPDGRTWYLPWGHRGGGNLDEAVVKEWFRREVRGKRITNINTRFDIHHGREWGIDLEAQGNEVSDVAHYAALLDDHRKRFNLDLLITDLFGKVEVPRLDETRMATYHAGEAAPRSMYNVRMVQALKELFWPMLDAEDLQRVRALEDKVIYPVCEMEKNGAPIDLELLDRWESASYHQLNRYLLALSREFGFQVNPDSSKDMEKVFQKLHIPISRTAKGAPSFTAAIMKREAAKHPQLGLIQKTGKLTDLRNKYLVKIKRCISSDGIMRYALHQLRAQKDPNSDNSAEAGTVTGRFSSTEIVHGEGWNQQQVMKVTKQRLQWGYEEEDASHDDEIFVIRQLTIPGAPDREWLAADAAQVEYRLFANYALNPKILEAYKNEDENDPKTWISFHRLTHAMVKPFKPDQSYRQQKDYNFAVIYGAQTIKQAVMLEFISKEEGEELRLAKRYDDPKLDEVKKIQKIYNELIPEASSLQKKASHLARPECVEWCRPHDRLHREFPHQGFVRDLLGRRCRFPDGQRTHKALNSIIQPGAASINKQKLVELHEERKSTGFLMRFTVHDEVDGDTMEPDTKEKVSRILNRQSFPELPIKILWDVSTGRNWKECA